MYERDLETHEPSCVARATKFFFILMIHRLPDVVRHVIAPELPSQKGKTPSREIRGSNGSFGR
jgi:hypothetical protein